MNLVQTVWLDFNYLNKHYEGEAIPALSSVINCLPPAFEIYFENEYYGTVQQEKDHWIGDDYIEEGLLKIIYNKLCSFLIRDEQN